MSRNRQHNMLDGSVGKPVPDFLVHGGIIIRSLKGELPYVPDYYHEPHLYAGVKKNDNETDSDVVLNTIEGLQDDLESSSFKQRGLVIRFIAPLALIDAHIEIPNISELYTFSKQPGHSSIVHVSQQVTVESGKTWRHGSVVERTFDNKVLLEYSLLRLAQLHLGYLHEYNKSLADQSHALVTETIRAFEADKQIARTSFINKLGSLFRK